MGGIFVTNAEFTPKKNLSTLVKSQPVALFCYIYELFNVIAPITKIFLQCKLRKKHKAYMNMNEYMNMVN